MRYKLVIWDFDGTLADTLHAALEIYNRLATERGYKTIIDPHSVRDMGMRDFMSKHGIPLYRVPLLFTTFLKELKSQVGQIALNENVAETVRRLAASGVIQYVVSSNDPQTINRCLSNHKLDEHFREICGTSRLFGKETRIRDVLREVGLDTREALYVGDEIRDIEAATAAGIDVAAVNWGLNSRQALIQNRPTWFVTRPVELIDIVCAVAEEAPPPRYCS